MGDEKYYKQVQDELDGKPRKFTDRALMAKAEVISEGDTEKTRFKYIELRVEQLKEKEDEKLRKAEEKARQEEEKKEQEKLKEIENKKDSTRSWVLWGGLFVGILIGRVFGLLGFMAIVIGGLVFDELYKTKSISFSIVISSIVIILSYLIGSVLVYFFL